MRGLAQYRNIRPASVLAPRFDPSSDPPGTITLDMLADFVRNAISSGVVLDFRDYNQLLYFVFTFNSQLIGDTDGGHHYWGQLDNQTFHFAWSVIPATANASHEVVEACTNPEGTGIYQPQGPIEIADICLYSSPFGHSDGISAVKYWSELDDDCILPERIAKVAIVNPDGGECSIGPSVGFKSTFSFSLGVTPDWIDDSNLPPLSNPKYAWTFDTTVAAAVSPTNQSTLTLEWLALSQFPTTVSVTITDDKRRKVVGSLRFRIHTQTQAELLVRICRLRQLVDSERKLPIWMVNPLGPDGPALPTEREIEQLNEFAKELSQQAQQILVASRGMER
jgi:hypothetical protein